MINVNTPASRTGRCPFRAVLQALVLSGVLAWGHLAHAQQEGTSSSTSEPNVPAAADPNATAPRSLMGTPTPTPSAETTLQALQARRKQAAESSDLSEESKSKLLDTYDKAIAQLRLAEELRDRKKQFDDDTKRAPETLRSIRESLDRAAPDPNSQVPADLTLAQAEQMLTQANLALEEARRTAANLESEPKKRAERRTKIPEETSVAKQRLEEIKTRLAELGQGEVSGPDQAMRTLLQLEQNVLQTRIETNADEFLFYDATNDLLAAQRDLAARQLSTAQRRAELLQQKVNALRQRAAEQARAEAVRAREETKFAHPAIQSAAEYNAALAQEQAELTSRIEEIGRYEAGVDETLAAVQKDLKETQQQVERAGGVTDVLGVRLTAKRGKLPVTTENRRRIRNRPGRINEAQLKWIEYDNEWSALTGVDERVQELLETAEPPVDPAEADAIRRDLTGQLQARRKTLETLSDLYLDYATRLANLDAKERELVTTVEEFGQFIDANILWVKSRHTPRSSDVAQVFQALHWLIAPANWRAILAALGQDFVRNAASYGLVGLLVLGVILSHGRIHTRIGGIAERVRQVETDSFLLTVEGLALTLVLAAVWPAVLLPLSWALSTAAPESEFARAVAAALRRLAYLLFVIAFFRHTFMPRGLGEAHFRLRKEPLAFLRRHLRWFFLASAPVVFVLEAMHAQQIDQEWYTTLGRLAFLMAVAALAAFLLIILRPSSPLLEGYLRQMRGGWVERLRYIWYPAAFLLPVAFGAVAVAGYFYGARYLMDKLLDTIVLATFVLLLRAMFVRWLVVAQRRLALLERRKRKAAEQSSQEGTGATGMKTVETTDSAARPEQTIWQISQQTRQLIDAGTAALLLVGVWYVWDNVLPAFAALGKHPLWTLSGQEQISLGAVTMALLVVVLTVVFARNVPGLLEIVILRRLPIDRAVRFAIITLIRYLIVVIGLVITFSSIGIGWSKVQWLIAAMTVGLGFGLQEIFANFVSGLIILFEQPVRVEDTVTVGDVSGKVTKIKIRATTIRTWDQRELIVPNKEFITGRLINWTLSDAVVRLDFPVGIAYGSDIRLAERLLYEVASSDSRVLSDPPPLVIFKGFGDNSLDFELRAHISGMDNYIPVRHTVNCAIDDAFRKAHVEIAFPQRDLHIRSVAANIPLTLDAPTQRSAVHVSNQGLSAGPTSDPTDPSAPPEGAAQGKAPPS